MRGNYVWRGLKRALGVLSVSVFIAVGSHAANVTVGWDPVTVNQGGSALTDLAGYRVFIATRSFRVGGVFMSTASAMTASGITKATTAGLTYAAVLAAGGTYYFRVTAFDASGNQSVFNLDASGNEIEVSTSIALPDTTLPQVSITSPLNGANVTGVITLAATATDDAGIASVQFSVDGVSLGTALKVAPFTTTWNTKSVKGGEHTITALAIDGAGNRASSSVTVKVRKTHVRFSWAVAAKTQDKTRALLSIKSDDPAFPSQTTLSAGVDLPSGYRTAVFTRLSTAPLVYSASLPAATVTSDDFAALEGSVANVTVSSQVYAGQGLGNAIDPLLGGAISEPSGLASVVIPAGGMTRDAQFALNAWTPPARGYTALARQELRSLGVGRDIVMTMADSGVLNTAILSMTFDPALIPRGLTTAQVRLAYFNAQTGSWEVVGNAEVNGNSVSAEVNHFSPYAPVLLLPASAAGLRDAFVYPNPAVGVQDPVIRASVGIVESVEVTVFDVSGRLVHSGAINGAPTGILNGEYFYDYTWAGRKASGVYFAVIHGKKVDGGLVRARAKFAVVR